MSIDKVIVIIMGFLGVVFTYWFFLWKKDKEIEAFGSVEILVNGGYSPKKIAISKGKRITLNFLRKDPSNCLEEIVIPDFKVRKFLFLNKKTNVEIFPQKTGTFPFSCGMGMFHGEIVVR